MNPNAEMTKALDELKTLIVSSPIVKNTLLSELMLTIWYSLGILWDLENGQILEFYYQK